MKSSHARPVARTGLFLLPGSRAGFPALGRRLVVLSALAAVLMAGCATGPSTTDRASPGGTAAGGSAPSSTASVPAASTPTNVSAGSPASAPASATAAPFAQSKDAEPAVRQAHAALLAALPFQDRQDFEDAQRGRIAPLTSNQVSAGTRLAWNLDDYAFLDADKAPATVNPSLWRQAQLNRISGLFEVRPGIYQVRGQDIANMTVIEGKAGLTIIDPLTSIEVARAALDLFYAHRPRKPVVAVIYTHSHADHFGGVKGVTTVEDVAAGRVRILAPNGFLAHAVSENVIAGTAMVRRADYQFGLRLPRGPRGQVDAGLGKAVADGSFSLIAPTEEIRQPIDRRTIDGVDYEFQLAPGTEAPAEMHIYLPASRVLNLAENAAHTFHNLLPLRGAEVRDPLAWSRYLNEAIDRYGARTDVLIGQHHWPTWGTERVRDFVGRQRDMYKFIHDQTVRLMNYGYGPTEIAEAIVPPPALARDWALRDYYGTVRHNVKAIYQRYLGWYDANPANLDPLPPTRRAAKVVAYMGGADAVVARARDDFGRGEFRWVVDALNQVIFAEPGHAAARALQADAYEQLGYLTESSTWRNAYLTAATELRRGGPIPGPALLLSPDLLQALPLDRYFDLMGVRLNGDRARDKRLRVNWRFTDLKEQYLVNLENSALTWRVSNDLGDRAGADATISLTRPTLDRITLRQTSFPAAVAAGDVRISGRGAALQELLGLLDPFHRDFELVEPRKVNAP